MAEPIWYGSKSFDNPNLCPCKICLHLILIIVDPLFRMWFCAGEIFMFALGNTQILYVTQPDMVREITTCTSLDFGKPTYQARERGSLLGQGILTSNGAVCAHQRKILAPELYMEKVKVCIMLVHRRFV